ncbi:MAG: single-stranded DNA-binding protein [Bacilli bacterium]|jgi:single-strand DNA-binding protein|nr:single-stranded DNA-binding protein [Bacilli bacterium]
MNRVVLVGRLTRDPEMRTTASGISQTRFTLAVNRRGTNEDGSRSADFINCVAWRGTGEAIAKYLKKGRELAVEGRIQTGSYDAQDGTKRYTTDVVVDNFTFIGSGANSAANNEDFNNGPSEDIATTDISEDPFKDFGNEVALSDDDLPF